MNNWCVLFVKTGMEDKITEKLKSSIDVSLALPFTITRERYVRKAGVFSVESNRCFPGYVFIQTGLLAEAIGIDVGKCQKNKGYLPVSDL
jgi:transcription antitermination factor NusG